VACRITELVLDAHDPDLLARFWCTVLGYVELDRVDGSIEIGPPESLEISSTLGYAQGALFRAAFGRVRAVPNSTVTIEALRRLFADCWGLQADQRLTA
jgi:hypothetical protein